MLVEVQANDTPSNSYYSPFRLEDKYDTFSSCLEAKFKHCKNNKGGMSAKEHASYVIKSLRRCKMIKFPYDPMRQKTINVESLCLQKFQRHF
jgi:hypothetical protein